MKKLAMVLLMVVSITGYVYAQPEQITITTYYPSPYGSYNDLEVHRRLTLLRTDLNTGELRLWTPTPAPDGSGWLLYNRGPDSIPGGDGNKLYLNYFDGTDFFGPHLVIQHFSPQPDINFPRVGIGKTNPTGIFEISHDNLTPDFFVGSRSCPKCVDVGIGTDDPEGRLGIKGDSERGGEASVSLGAVEGNGGEFGFAGLRFVTTPGHSARIELTGGPGGYDGNLNIQLLSDIRRITMSAGGKSRLTMGYTDMVGIGPNLAVGNYIVPLSPDPQAYTFRVSENGIVNDLVVNLDGQVCINCDQTSQADVKLDVDGNLKVRQMRSYVGVIDPLYYVFSDAEGLFYQGPLVPSSSKKYKKDIRDLKVDPAKVFQLRPVEFRWKESGKEDIGLIAEEVDTAIKDLVVYDKEGKPNGVKYDKVPLYLLEALKEQQNEIEYLKTETERIQVSLEKLEARLD
ncbi:tail fiber domain-containing protein [Candidatus Omnitrophota bacterium]